MQDQDLEKIRDDAAKWVIRNENGLSAAEQDQFNEWLTSNPEHSTHYARHKSYWADMDRLAGLQAFFHKKVDPDLLEDEILPHMEKRKLKYGVSVVVGLAACFLVMFAVTNFQFGSGLSQPVLATDLQIERIQKLDLEDGSTVFLNRSAYAETRYTDEERLVVLKSGEAHFDVAKDFNRPFVVDVHGVRIRAVGTAFNVNYQYDKVDVFVTEGIIAVHSSELSDEETLEESYVEINQHAVVSLDQKQPEIEVNSLAEHEIEDMLLWKPQLIDFQNTPLEQIIDEFNRRNDIKIVIRDNDIGDIRITSIFWSDNLGGFVRLLEAKFGIMAVYQDDRAILLTRSID